MALANRVMELVGQDTALVIRDPGRGSREQAPATLPTQRGAPARDGRGLIFEDPRDREIEARGKVMAVGLQAGGEAPRRRESIRGRSNSGTDRHPCCKRTPAMATERPLRFAEPVGVDHPR
jgi:hypothetical protein